MTTPNLITDIAGVVFKNPVILASGCAGFGYDIADVLDFDAIGALVTKTVTPSPREGNIPPRICETDSGMINSIGLQNPGIDSFLRDHIPQIAQLPTKIIVSLGANDEQSFAEIIRKADCIQCTEVFELNFSCPNVKSGGIHFAKDKSTVARIVEEAKRLTVKKIWVKISPQITDIAHVARTVEAAGADAITVANTFPAIAVDIATRKPKIGNVIGGLSGAAIHPATLFLIFTVAKAVSIPVIASGGVTSCEKFVETMLVGAKAVQIGSGFLRQPSFPSQIPAFLSRYMQSQGFSSLDQLVGNLRLS